MLPIYPPPVNRCTVAPPKGGGHLVAPAGRFPNARDFPAPRGAAASRRRPGPRSSPPRSSARDPPDPQKQLVFGEVSWEKNHGKCLKISKVQENQMILDVAELISWEKICVFWDGKRSNLKSSKLYRKVLEMRKQWKIPKINQQKVGLGLVLYGNIYIYYIYILYIYM